MTMTGEKGTISEIADRIISTTTGDYDIYTSTLEMNAGGSVVLTGEDNGVSFSGDPEDAPEDAFEDKSDDDLPTCDECSKEFTIEQIKAIVGKQLAKKGSSEKEAEGNIKRILEYVNKYRKKYKLDTCIRKAQFISQALAETENLQNLFEAGENSHYSAAGLLNNFNNKKITRFYKDALLKDYFIKPQNDEKKCYGYLSEAKILEMIKVEYDKDFKGVKLDLKELMQKDIYGTIQVNQAALYGAAKDDTFFSKDTVLYKDKELTITLKKHSAHDVESMSRAYAYRPDDLENNDELSGDGYKFMGKGVLQLTGRGSYTRFTAFRNKEIKKNKSQFDDDDPNSPVIDFTVDYKDSTKEKPKGYYNTLADLANPIYAVQSAVWEWAVDKESALFRKRRLVDKDDVGGVTNTINGGYNGLSDRNSNMKKARKDNAFKVYMHYEYIYKNGSDEEKAAVLKNLEFITSTNVVDGIELKDDNKEASELFSKLKAQQEDAEKEKKNPLLPSK